MTVPVVVRVVAGAGIATFVGVRIWRTATRRRRGGAGSRPGGTPGTDRTDRPGRLPRRMRERAPFGGEVSLVAGREIRERYRSRVFRVGTILMLAVVAGAVAVPVLTRGTPTPQRVGVVGPLPAPLRAALTTAAKGAGTSVHYVTEQDQQGAERDLRSGRLDIVVVDGRRLVTDAPVDAASTSTASRFAVGASKELGIALALEAAHLTPAQSAALGRAAAVPLVSLAPHPTSGAAKATSLLALIIVFVMLTQYGGWTLMGVMEEKSSRVSEVLLAAVPPVRLLAGKVTGIGLMALAQASLLAGVALALGKAVGSDVLAGTAPTVLGAAFVWLVLGYAFTCWLYAAAGSMAERQDQVQTLAVPLSVPALVGYVASITAVSSGHASAFVTVLAYLPPTAPFAMPVLVGLGAVTWWQFLVSIAITVASTVAVARVAAAVYRRAILRTGRRVRLRDVFPRPAR